MQDVEQPWKKNWLLLSLNVGAPTDQTALLEGLIPKTRLGDGGRDVVMKVKGKKACVGHCSTANS